MHTLGALAGITGRSSCSIRRIVTSRKEKMTGLPTDCVIVLSNISMKRIASSIAWLFRQPTSTQTVSEWKGGQEPGEHARLFPLSVFFCNDPSKCNFAWRRLNNTTSLLGEASYDWVFAIRPGTNAIRLCH